MPAWPQGPTIPEEHFRAIFPSGANALTVCLGSEIGAGSRQLYRFLARLPKLRRARSAEQIFTIAALSADQALLDAFAAEKEDLRILAPGETLEAWEASFFAGSLLVKHDPPLPKTGRGRRGGAGGMETSGRDLRAALNPALRLPQAAVRSAGLPVRNSGLDKVIVFLGEPSELWSEWFGGEPSVLAEIYAPLPTSTLELIPTPSKPLRWAVVPGSGPLGLPNSTAAINWERRGVEILTVEIETYVGALERYAAALK
jgi:hypothetical protein